MSAYTPGPWIVEDMHSIERGADVCSADKRVGICNCNPQDAHLIAAAPDLLRELQFVLRGIDSGHIKCAPYFDFDPDAAQIEFKSVGTRVREVLAKATGSAS